MSDSYSVGIQISRYQQLVLFQSKSALRDVLGVNTHMEAVVGLDDEENRLFPEVFIAGILKPEYTDKSVDRPPATQK